RDNQQHVPYLPIPYAQRAHTANHARLCCVNDTPTTEIYTLSLHDALPICHLARKLSLRRKRSSPNVFEMAATETITSIILIKLIRVSLGTVRHPRRFKIVVIDIQITLKQMLRDFIGIRVNRAKK